jgi:hypothetical protein
VADKFDWHSTPICRTTLVAPGYRNTQNVRRFLRVQCGPQFKFDRPFIQWIKDGKPKTMGDGRCSGRVVETECADGMRGATEKPLLELKCPVGSSSLPGSTVFAMPSDQNP